MTRTFESNGPDVKVRGTAAHIAEKYMALARDAQSSGDPVAAENYFQHAEHYNRIVMAAQAQFQQSQPPQHRGPAEDDEDGLPERGDPRYGGWNGWDPRDARHGDDDRMDDDGEPPRPYRDDFGRSSRDDPARRNRDRFPPRDAAPQPEGGRAGDGVRQDARQDRNADNGGPLQPQAADERSSDGAPADVADAAQAEDGERRRPLRRRRPRPAAVEGGAAPDEAAGTRDGEAALTAFPD
jgi:hypothetical protein